MKAVLIFLALIAPLIADVPPGVYNTGDLTAVVSLYGVCPNIPSWLLPPCDPNAVHGVMLNLKSTSATTPTKVVVSIVVQDVDGTTESFTQISPWSPNADNWATVIVQMVGTPSMVLTVSITEIMPGQEHVLH